MSEEEQIQHAYRTAVRLQSFMRGSFEKFNMLIAVLYVVVSREGVSQEVINPRVWGIKFEYFMGCF